MSNHLEYEINKELGECYLFMGDFDKAESYYRKAIAASTTNADPFLGLATISVQRGQLEAAMTLYGKALELEPSDKALSGMGLISMELGKNDAAFSYFGDALHLNPENAVALNCLVRAAYTLDCVADAVPYLESALVRTPDKEEVLVTLAGCLMSIGQGSEARPHLETVLSKNPLAVDAKDLYEHLAA